MDSGLDVLGSDILDFVLFHNRMYWIVHGFEIACIGLDLIRIFTAWIGDRN